MNLKPQLTLAYACQEAMQHYEWALRERHSQSRFVSGEDLDRFDELVLDPARLEWEALWESLKANVPHMELNSNFFVD